MACAQKRAKFGLGRLTAVHLRTTSLEPPQQSRQTSGFSRAFSDTALIEAKIVEKKARNTKQFQRDPRAVAEGFLRVAVGNMANAIKQVSVQKGHDATRFALQCFGGAGGQHACLVADELGMETVVIHPFAGVLSAYGMGLADQTVMREQAVEVPFAT